MAAKLPRPRVAAMDDILGVEYKLLDHGFIRVIDYMGDDAAIVQAARVSYGDGTKSLREDTSLIRYLLRRAHTTPFEMCELKLHVKLPIFAARQWIRHRTANVNEYSARYSIMDKEFYVPDAGELRKRDRWKDAVQAEKAGQKPMWEKTETRVAYQSQTNKQGRGEAMSAAEAEEHARKIRELSRRAYTAYKGLLKDGEGLSRELARMVLPTNFYTQWFWKIDLHNLLRFLLLRADPHAQYEIRVYAQKIIDEILPRWVPAVAAAFAEYQTGAMSLSAAATATVKKWLDGDRDYLAEQLSEREATELKRALLGKSRSGE